MAKLPREIIEDPTLVAVDRAMEAEQDTGTRAYLGMSGIGRPCSRELWLQFRWAGTPAFPANVLKKFEDGHAGEAMQAARLRMVRGVELHTEGADGEQIGFTDIGDHVRGHMDGAIHGLKQAPKTWHVWEHKQVSDKKFDELQKLTAKHGEKEALSHWDLTYYAQAQLYMHYSTMHRHYLTVSTPGGRDTISVRTEYDAEVAKHYIKRARDIIDAVEPPEKLSEDPEFWQCKSCTFHLQCHGTEFPLVNCRTCLHSTPDRTRPGAVWHCERHSADIPGRDEQRAGCDEHRYIPAFLARVAEVVDADSAANTVRYRLLDSGNEIDQPAWTSEELRITPVSMLNDKFVAGVKEKFGATVTDVAAMLPVDDLEKEFAS